MMGLPTKPLWISLCAVAALAPGCSSRTVEKLNSFADKICACKDAACAEKVQAEYLAWWKENQRARGSEGDRKEVEKAMQRYAECHNRLSPPEPKAVEAPSVPKVDLAPAAQGGKPAPAREKAAGAPSEAPAEAKEADPTTP